MTYTFAFEHDLPRPALRGRLLGAVAAALVAATLGSPVAASAATPRYPDLRILAPTALGLRDRTIGGEPHKQIHFTTVPWNAGEGALEIHRTPTLSGIADLTQRIYEDPAGFRDEPLGSVVFAAADFVFHVPDLARYEVWSERTFKRAMARDFERGQPLYFRDGITHCFADLTHVDPDAGPPVEVYERCTKFVTGLSVGWGDIEERQLGNQSVDFGTSLPPDGDYVLRVIVDPTNLIFESDGRADPAREGHVANSAISYFRLVNGQLAGVT